MRRKRREEKKKKWWGVDWIRWRVT